MKRAVFGNTVEVHVCGQQSQLVTNAKLSDQCVDRSCLNSAHAAQIAQFRSGNIIFSVRIQERKCREALDDLLFGFGTSETLQELLQYETRAQNTIAGFEGMDERVNLRNVGRPATAQQQRPDAGVYQEVHPLNRVSALSYSRSRDATPASRQALACSSDAGGQ